MTGYLALTLFVIVMATLPDNSQLLNLKDTPKMINSYQTARVDQEVNPETLSNLPLKKSIGKLEESALARGSCSSKVRVAYSTKNDAFTQRNYIFGYYKIEQGLINGKPHYTSIFANGQYSIWYNDAWNIGLSREKGTTYTFAYNRNNCKCPYDPAYDWFYLDYYRNWRSAGSGLSIWSASSSDLNEDGKLNLLEASPYLFESGKITGIIRQISPEWFKMMNKNKDEFIQQKELDSDY